MSAKVQFWAP